MELERSESVDEEKEEGFDAKSLASDKVLDWKIYASAVPGD